MSLKKILLMAMSVTLVTGQRPSFAGSRPIGFPEVIKPTTEGLSDRFGEDGVSTTTMRLPLEANGDRDLVDRISKLPVDQQPFWYLNWQALEENRKNPQTYPQKPNVFAEPMAQNQQTSQQASQQQFSQQQPSQQQFSQQLPTQQFSQQLPTQQFPSRGQFPQQMPSQSTAQQQAELQQQMLELQKQRQELAEERRKFMELQQQFMEQQQQLSNRNGVEASGSQRSGVKTVNPVGRFSMHNHSFKPRTPTVEN